MNEASITITGKQWINIFRWVNLPSGLASTDVYDEQLWKPGKIEASVADGQVMFRLWEWGYKVYRVSGEVEEPKRVTHTWRGAAVDLYDPVGVSGYEVHGEQHKVIEFSGTYLGGYGARPELRIGACVNCDNPTIYGDIYYLARPYARAPLEYKHFMALVQPDEKSWQAFLELIAKLEAEKT